MKNPNGYGTVTKLSGNRRKPYIVKEGVSGRQKPIGYAATHSEVALILPGQTRFALIESWGINRKEQVNGFTPIKI